jgi:hypothetical protein
LVSIIRHQQALSRAYPVFSLDHLVGDQEKVAIDREPDVSRSAIVV